MRQSLLYEQLKTERRFPAEGQVPVERLRLHCQTPAALPDFRRNRNRKAGPVSETEKI